MAQLPSLQMLKSFEAVSRLGSFTQAAAELHVSHSAISQQIKALEAYLGRQLLQRQAKKIMVSEDGRLYAIQIRDALKSLEDATFQLKSNPRQAELVIATLPSFAAHWLAPRLLDFRQQYPQIRLKLQVNLTVGDLTEQYADIAIRMGNGDWRAAAQKDRLFYDELWVVAAADFQQGRLYFSDQQIIETPVISSMEAWNLWCEQTQLSLPEQTLLQVNDSNVVIEMLRRGLGIALERKSVVFDLVQQGVLKKISKTVAAYPWAYWSVIPEGQTVQPETHLFLDWLKQQVAVYEQSSGLSAAL
ncbi:LysR substrate-binding domain-containing protein [Acinetobacter sp. ANC 4641]|uniref:LysR substrate-binding domain-containing protein n=1 Tax=Acinetobacter sp. ANC 4641 TaxID=2529847 RepID=UPI00103C47D2|nr:LysR substrate-binding domain-containing protein [Acinetobacter sp. ANC 4641]TCB08334.1 LysR family transcriptional regulator [Acinetobacter sp. ANC 4641]